MKRLALLAILTLGACGLRQPLRPAPGDAMPIAPPMSSRALTTDELIAPPTTARPGRIDELLSRSEERGDNRFELAPGDVPVETNQAEDGPQ
jgi:hypothetical protein